MSEFRIDHLDGPLSHTKRGICVRCLVCGHVKTPIGRSAPMNMTGCDRECVGYYEFPRPGSLWPNESEADFGYPVDADGTNEATR